MALTLSDIPDKLFLSMPDGLSSHTLDALLLRGLEDFPSSAITGRPISLPKNWLRNLNYSSIERCKKLIFIHTSIAVKWGSAHSTHSNAGVTVSFFLATFLQERHAAICGHWNHGRSKLQVTWRDMVRRDLSNC